MLITLINITYNKSGPCWAITTLALNQSVSVLSSVLYSVNQGLQVMKFGRFLSYYVHNFEVLYLFKNYYCGTVIRTFIIQETWISHIHFVDITAVSVKSSIFCDITLCSQMKIN
jgi:hypothetical protein